jgi:iron(III) transport system ATP-binding protein
LARKPKLLLLDEPFSNLDVDLRERLAQDVRAILKQIGATALFVTHDQMEAFAIGDVIGVMQAGQLEQWDDAYTLYHRPASRFVAQFIGHGVFTPGTLVSAQGGTQLHTALGKLADVANAPNTPHCDVLLRADDVVHDDSSPTKARIERKAFRGAEFLYTLSLPSGEQLLAHVPSHHRHEVGQWIGVRAQVDHVVTFSPQSVADSAA